MKKQFKYYIVTLLLSVLLFGFIQMNIRYRLIDVLPEELVARGDDLASIHITYQILWAFSEDEYDETFYTQEAIASILDVIGRMELKRRLTTSNSAVVRGLPKHYTITIKETELSAGCIIIIFDKRLSIHYDGRVTSYTILNPLILDDLDF